MGNKTLSLATSSLNWVVNIFKTSKMTNAIKDCHCFESEGSYNWTVNGCVHAELALASIESICEQFRKKDVIAFGLKQINGKSKSFLIFKNYFEKPEIFDCAIRVKSNQTIVKISLGDSHFVDSGEEVNYSQDSFLSDALMSYTNKKLLMTQKYIYGMDHFYFDNSIWDARADHYTIINDRKAFIVEDIYISNENDDVLMSAKTFSKKNGFNSELFGITFLWLLKLEDVVDDLHVSNSTSITLSFYNSNNDLSKHSRSLKTWFELDDENSILVLVDQPSNIVCFGDDQFLFTSKGLRNYIFSLEEVRYESLLAAWDLV